jgi:hypothetical protein
MSIFKMIQEYGTMQRDMVEDSKSLSIGATTKGSRDKTVYFLDSKELVSPLGCWI